MKTETGIGTANMIETTVITMQIEGALIFYFFLTLQFFFFSENINCYSFHSKFHSFFH